MDALITMTAYWHEDHWCLTPPQRWNEPPCDRIYTKREVFEFGAKMLDEMARNAER